MQCIGGFVRLYVVVPLVPARCAAGKQGPPLFVLLWPLWCCCGRGLFLTVLFCISSGACWVCHRQAGLPTLVAGAPQHCQGRGRGPNVPAHTMRAPHHPPQPQGAPCFLLLALNPKPERLKSWGRGRWGRNLQLLPCIDTSPKRSRSWEGTAASHYW